MPRRLCPDCGVEVMVDPAGRCPDGHVVEEATVEHSFGQGPHPDEPQPWTFAVDDDASPAAPDRGPEGTPRTPDAPAPRPSLVDDDLVAALQAITDPADRPPAAAHDDAPDPDARPDLRELADVDEPHRGSELDSLEAALADLGVNGAAGEQEPWWHEPEASEPTEPITPAPALWPEAERPPAAPVDGPHDAEARPDHATHEPAPSPSLYLDGGDGDVVPAAVGRSRTDRHEPLDLSNFTARGNRSAGRRRGRFRR